MLTSLFYLLLLTPHMLVKKIKIIRKQIYS